MITFEDADANEAVGKKWDEQITDACLQVNAVVEAMEKKGLVPAT